MKCARHCCAARRILPPAGPEGIALDSVGHVYVVNHGHHEHYLQKFDSSGNLLLEWGVYGTGPGEFIQSGGVAVDSRGDVYASDANNYRFQKFDSNGNFLAAFGSIGQGPGQFIAGPYGLAVDAAGNVYAPETSGRVQKFDGTAGNLLAAWDRTGVTRLIATDDRGDVFIRDDNARTIVKYRQP